MSLVRKGIGDLGMTLNRAEVLALQSEDYTFVTCKTLSEWWKFKNAMDRKGNFSCHEYFLLPSPRPPNPDKGDPQI
jgi:hypothetical protein